MIRPLILICVLAIGCDRADELILSAMLESLSDPPPVPSYAKDCAKGYPRFAAPQIMLAVDCGPPQDGGR